MPEPAKMTPNPVAPPSLGLERRIVRLVAYDPRWPEWFAAEAARLRNVLGNRIGEIEHIGSTAIPNMAAKPTIDILVAIPDREEVKPAIIEKMKGNGYH